MKTEKPENIGSPDRLAEFVTMAKLELTYRLAFVGMHKAAASSALRSTDFTATPTAIARAFTATYMAAFGPETRVRRQIEKCYVLAKMAMIKRLNGFKGRATYEISDAVQKAETPEHRFTFTFDLRDEGAIKELQDSYLFWYGSHYSERISDAIKAAVLKTKFEEGFSRVETGAAIKESVAEIMGLEAGSFSESYFEGLAASVTTTARAAGSLSGLVSGNAQTYVISNPEDERTCPRCSAVVGIPLPVPAAVAQLERLRAAKSVEDVKSAQPWYSITDFLAVGTKVSDLVAAGIILPPFHFLCRCSVDIGPGVIE